MNCPPDTDMESMTITLPLRCVGAHSARYTGTVVLTNPMGRIRGPRWRVFIVLWATVLQILKTQNLIGLLDHDSFSNLEIRLVLALFNKSEKSFETVLQES